QIFRQAIVIQRQIAQPVAEVFVRADIERHVVVIDRIVNGPVVARVAIAQVSFADKPSVGNIGERTGNGDVQLHALDFIALLVFVGPPDAGADAFARGRDPVPPGGVFAKADAAKTARLLRRAGVIKLD